MSEEIVVSSHELSMHTEEKIDEAIFSVDVTHMRNVIEEQLAEISSNTPESHPDRIGLNALWIFSEGLRCLLANDFNRAYLSFNEAESNFKLVEESDLADLCVALSRSAQGIVQLMAHNIGEGIEILESGKRHIQKAGKYSSKFEHLLDHLEPSLLVAQAIPMMMENRHEDARVLFTRASAKSREIAKTHYGEDKVASEAFKGIGDLYEVIFGSTSWMQMLNRYDFDSITSDDRLIQKSKATEERLSSLPESPVFESAVEQSHMYALLSGAIFSIARSMQKIFESTLKPQIQDLRKLKESINSASAHAARVGPGSEALVRMCGDLQLRINNIQKLARPTKKDFGIYGGIITSAIFLVSTVILLWANSFFSTDIEGKDLIKATITISLIGGFGLAALKFKGLFQSSGD